MREREKKKRDFNLCFKKNGWCIKLKLVLLDEVMSRDETFLCFLRGAAGRAVRMTFWPPRLLVKVPCQYLLFLHRFHCLLLDSPSSPGHWEAAKSCLIDCTNEGCLSLGFHPCSGCQWPNIWWPLLVIFVLWQLFGVLFCSLSWSVPYSGIILRLMLGNIEEISDVTSELHQSYILYSHPPISSEIRMFWLDYPVLHNDGALEEALEIPPWSTQLNPFRGHSLKLVLCCHWQIFSKQPKENHRSCDFLKGHF